ASLEQVSPDERRMTQELVREMGSLPLTLDQAGAYLEETACGLATYLALYREKRAHLLQRRGGLLTEDHPEPVAMTWSLSFAKVEQANAAVAYLLPWSVPGSLSSTRSRCQRPHACSIAQGTIWKHVDATVRSCPSTSVRWLSASRSWDRYILLPLVFKRITLCSYRR